MNNPQSTNLKTAEYLEQMRQQFDQAPYPRVPIEEKYTDSRGKFYVHSLATAFYARDGRWNTNKIGQVRSDSPGQKTILDVGCGSGYKALLLAGVNPQSHVVGVDLSAKSIELATERFRYHNLADRGQFFALDLLDLASLGQTFDYINCDEVLYLLPDPLAALEAITSVLKPDGILRVNLHNFRGRLPILESQKFFREVGLNNQNLAEDMPVVESAIDAIHDSSVIIRAIWNQKSSATQEAKEELMAANFLLFGDRGFTINQAFELIAAADLEVISPTEPSLWKLDLVFNWAKLPPVLKERFDNSTLQEQMRWYDQLTGGNRLIDLLCTPCRQGNSGGAKSLPITLERFKQVPNVLVTLHPLLQTTELRSELEDTCRYFKPLDLNKFIVRPLDTAPVSASLSPLLIPLLDNPQTVDALITRYRFLHPIDPLSQSPLSLETATQRVQEFLINLRDRGYLFLESLES